MCIHVHSPLNHLGPYPFLHGLLKQGGRAATPTSKRVCITMHYTTTCISAAHRSSPTLQVRVRVLGELSGEFKIDHMMKLLPGDLHISKTKHKIYEIHVSKIQERIASGKNACCSCETDAKGFGTLESMYIYYLYIYIYIYIAIYTNS